MNKHQIVWIISAFFFAGLSADKFPITNTFLHWLYLKIDFLKNHLWIYTIIECIAFQPI